MQSYIATVQAFFAALVERLNHQSTPEHARQWFDEAATEVANQHGRKDGETLADALLAARVRRTKERAAAVAQGAAGTAGNIAWADYVAPGR